MTRRRRSTLQGMSWLSYSRKLLAPVAAGRLRRQARGLPSPAATIAYVKPGLALVGDAAHHSSLAGQELTSAIAVASIFLAEPKPTAKSGLACRYSATRRAVRRTTLCGLGWICFTPGLATICPGAYAEKHWADTRRRTEASGVEIRVGAIIRIQNNRANSVSSLFLGRIPDTRYCRQRLSGFALPLISWRANEKDGAYLTYRAGTSASSRMALPRRLRKTERHSRDGDTCCLKNHLAHSSEEKNCRVLSVDQKQGFLVTSLLLSRKSHECRLSAGILGERARPVSLSRCRRMDMPTGKKNQPRCCRLVRLKSRTGRKRSRSEKKSKVMVRVKRGKT